tara:strand:+ start:1628 stop:5419 length:3792 start_codon:yes stop_codon:yes gene_type:complete
MKRIDFYKYNRLFGIITGLIAFTVFALTVEPTASYWDCAEYISTSAKLQIGHPPGAPLFQMLGAIFSIFALETTQIAYAVNMMSVFSSALTVMFLFWSISLIGKEITKNNRNLKINDAIKIYGASFLGSSSFTFTDSFWYNAVEAEVYAMATLILSILFWLGLKWADDYDSERSNKWLILISFVAGLSFGVHFMGLLAIPSIVLIYFFKKRENFNYSQLNKKINPYLLFSLSTLILFTFTFFGEDIFFFPLGILTFLLILFYYKRKNIIDLVWDKYFVYLFILIFAVAILFVVFKGILPLTLSLFGNLEVFFVNDLGLPFNSGTIFSAALIIYIIYFCLSYSSKNRIYWLNNTVLCLTFVFIGFSSWLMIPIRSNANTVINENAPSDARSLLAYYNLEQYPDTYLFYGPMFSDIYAGQDPQNPYKDDKPKYERDYKTNKYIIVNDWKDGKINSNRNHEGLFPRMWSSGNATNYMNYFGFLDFEIKNEYKNEPQIVDLISSFKNRITEDDVDADDYHKFLTNFGSYLDIEKPSLMTNIKYFINYQFVQMYFRYFMWNFSGRQNDKQWKYDLENGNWLSGINMIDEFRLGPQEELPDDVLNNKARNKYYFIPFILGLIGLIFIFNRSLKSFWPVLLLFLFTGIALKFYLNERVFEPRERDYALVGSFYAYSIFIGISFIALSEYLVKYLKQKISFFITIAITISCPLLLSFNNWDDHDRSKRYTAQTLARAYLDSIDEDKQAIIFTIGDNDTFALWYAQEIENHRTDVRTINTSLIATDWYMDQMKRKAYKSDPILSNLKHEQYVFGTRDYIKYENLESLFDNSNNCDGLKKLLEDDLPDRWDLKLFMSWISNDENYTKYKYILECYGYTKEDLEKIPGSTENMIYYPNNKLRFYVNKENVLNSGIINKTEIDNIVDYIDIELPKSGLYKNQILMLDILSKNDWKRPIYFTGGSYKDSEYLWMKDFLQLDGLVYKLVPIKTPINEENPYQMGRIEPYRMYDIVKKWEWGNSESSEIYHDPETRKNSISFRGNLHRLAESFVSIGENVKAKEIMDLSFEKMPLEYFEYYSLSEPYISTYHKIGEKDKAQKLYSDIEKKYLDQIKYYSNSLENYPDFFSISDYAENIFTYTERYRGLIENEILEGNYIFASKSIENFLNYTQSFKTIYGEYDYYSFLLNFVEPLYISEKSKIGRELYLKIQNEINSRLETIISAKDESSLDYLINLFEQEIKYSKDLLSLIADYESSEFIENESLKLINLEIEFTSK